MNELNVMWSLIVLITFVYGASASPADPTITGRASLGSIEARSNQYFIGWVYDPVYSECTWLILYHRFKSSSLILLEQL
jgi:hypothetical protein